MTCRDEQLLRPSGNVLPADVLERHVQHWQAALRRGQQMRTAGPRTLFASKEERAGNPTLCHAGALSKTLSVRCGHVGNTCGHFKFVHFERLQPVVVTTCFALIAETLSGLRTYL